MTETLLIWLAGLWLLWLPGVAIHRGLVRLGLRPTPDALHSGAIQIGLGLALWPILFLWTSSTGLVWQPPIAQIVAVGLGGVGLVCLLWTSGSAWRGRLARLRGRSVEMLAWGALIVLTVNSRLAQIRELVVPNWVDSVHHAMILRIFVDGGHLPATFAPFLPNNNFLYHWGYHANAAWLAWLLGWSDPFQLTELMLHFGQLLNSLTLIMVYAAGRTLFHSRRAGMLAAVLAVLVSWYPAFYVSWGRYTQLSGLLIMAPFMIQLWSLHRTRRMTLGDLLAVILLGGGLVLIHVRVAFFAITLGVVLAGVVVLEERWRTFGRWTLAGLGIVAISGPWLWRLVSSSWIQRFYAPMTVVDPNPLFSDYNAIQWGLVWVPRSRELFALATGGLSGLLGWGDPSQTCAHRVRDLAGRVGGAGRMDARSFPRSAWERKRTLCVPRRRAPGGPFPRGAWERERDPAWAGPSVGTGPDPVGLGRGDRGTAQPGDFRPAPIAHLQQQRRGDHPLCALGLGRGRAAGLGLGQVDPQSLGLAHHSPGRRGDRGVGRAGHGQRDQPGDDLGPSGGSARPGLGAGECAGGCPLRRPALALAGGHLRRGGWGLLAAHPHRPPLGADPGPLQHRHGPGQL